ncbi:VOC family protein [Kribbella sp.]|uniref:VOC family protein n=1 Tax=Kribbella sp. TaxID=1871183 RepID=UPI002D2F3862|nr:VOC family protein [Kribbella sp.]HZX03728.1 VOC family protein [Kribbella sp.]
MNDWRKLQQYLHARFLTSSFAQSAGFATAIGDQPGLKEVRLAETFVDVKVELPEPADAISRVAAEQGLRADPTQVTQLEIGLDTADRAEIGPFWAAVLTGDAGNFKDNDVVDPTGRFDNVWFQQTEPHETPRQRFHFDLWVPPEVVADRIKAAVAAGGTVVSTDEAPAFTVLADPQGNKVCLCTSEGR